MCVFIMLFPSYVVVYPFTATSSIVYTISTPSSYFGKFVNSYTQSVSDVAVVSVTFVFFPFTVLYNSIVILSGLIPS